MNDGSNIPNEAGVETVDNSNVHESAPVWTSQTPQREAKPTEAAPVETQPTEGEPAPANDNGDANQAQPTEQTTEEIVQEPSGPTAEQIEKWSQAADYQPEELEVNFVDELGNFDPAKFAEFMKQNNQNLFQKATEAVNARNNLSQIENQSWASIESDFPEIAQNDTLTKALRGARIQDVMAGGDGDLKRLATDIVGPMRQHKIDAVENVNRQVTEQQKLETFAPENAAPEKAPVSLMNQLKQAVSSGNRDEASRLRHAIRKERIAANNS